MATDPDWQSLERKLAAGMPLERAAEAVGVDIEEARRWARLELDQIDAEDVTLMKTANSMLQTGFRVLERIALAGQRESTVEEMDENGKTKQITKFSDADLDAAKELMRAALMVRKMLGPARGAKTGPGGRIASVQLDIFDGKGPWDLETP